MEFFDVVKNRGSYRGEFLPEAVRDEDLERILDAGIRAPSGYNLQTTSFIAVKDARLRAEIAGILADAHGAYEAKFEELETAKAELEAAEEALAAAKADKEATAKDLAAAEADYAMAKEAYDKLCALMGWDEEPEQGAGQTTKPAGDRTPEQQAGPDDLPGTGDPASVAAAGLALGGLFSVAAGAHFRRRDEK